MVSWSEQFRVSPSEGGSEPLLVFAFSHLLVSWEGTAVLGCRCCGLCQSLHRQINSYILCRITRFMGTKQARF